MNKSIKYSFAIMTIFLTSLFTLSFLSFAPMNQDKNVNESVQSKNTETRIFKPGELSEDVESLMVSADLKNQTITYDIEFKTNEFNGKEVRSLFYERSTIDGVPQNQYLKIPFKNSTTTIERKHATNTTSYEQVLTDGLHVVTSLSSVRFNVEYEKADGSYTVASLLPIHFWVLEDREKPFVVDDTKTRMEINDAKTFGQAYYSFTLNERTSIDSIYLKSHSDKDLNQRIYSIEDENNALWQGSGVLSFQLLNNYHYSDLYLQYRFKDVDPGFYTWDSDITNNLDFKSGVVNNSWSTTNIILLIIVISLIILTIFFIVLVLKQMKERKELEKQQDQAYYDENYEDGM